MKKNKSISRIEKVLKKIKDGSFTESDIDVLFVTARELPSASKNIFEMGSFVAHNYQRDQGVINDIMLRNHLLMSLAFGRDKNNVRPDLNEFPKYLPLLIKLQLKIFNDNYFKKLLGLKGGQVATARKRLTNKKSYIVKGDVCKLTPEIGANEAKIIQETLSVLCCSDAIEFDLLFDELKNLLRNEIPDEDLTPLDNNRMKIAGVLACLVNNITFLLMDGVKASTVFSPLSDEQVSVSGLYHIVHDKEPYVEIGIMSPVFNTGYKKTELFDENVKDEHVSAGDVEFSFELGKIVASHP